MVITVGIGLLHISSRLLWFIIGTGSQKCRFPVDGKNKHQPIKIRSFQRVDMKKKMIKARKKKVYFQRVVHAAVS